MEKEIHVVNMLGCHDGIPLLDLKGLIPEERIQQIIDTVVARGGYVKDLHGQKNVYYQVNATYYSALGEDDKKNAYGQSTADVHAWKPQDGTWIFSLARTTTRLLNVPVPAVIKKSTVPICPQHRSKTDEDRYRKRTVETSAF